MLLSGTAHESSRFRLVLSCAVRNAACPADSRTGHHAGIRCSHSLIGRPSSSLPLIDAHPAWRPARRRWLTQIELRAGSVRVCCVGVPPGPMRHGASCRPSADLGQGFGLGSGPDCCCASAEVRPRVLATQLLSCCIGGMDGVGGTQGILYGPEMASMRCSKVVC